MQDLETPATINTLRALVFQVLWLLTGSMASVAYKRTTAGLTTALRMGYHVSSPGLSDDDQFRRRQVLSVLYISHVNLASALGMPVMRDIDVIQLLPLRQADLHDEGKACVAGNPHTPEAEAILATKLHAILVKVNLCRHPANKTLPRNGDTYEVSYSEMEDFEGDLERWYECLPLIDTVPMGGRALLAQLTLRYVYAVIQMGLYRPFLHHLTTDATDARFDERGYAYGSGCIRAAMQAVWWVNVSFSMVIPCHVSIS